MCGCAVTDLPKGTVLWTPAHAPKGSLGLYLARFQGTEPQLSTAGPATSFLFHLPSASWQAVDSQLPSSGRPLGGVPIPEELPQQPGNADRAGARAPHLPATLRRLPAAAAAALSPGSQAKEFRLRPRVRAHEAHTTRLPGDRALTVPRSEPSVPCASYSRLAFRKALSRLFSEVGGAAAPGAHLGAEEGRGVAGRRHRCAEQKQHGRG